MDISDTLAPNSQQLDAVDLLGGPRVFTVERVTRGNAEQPVQVHLAEFDRPWRPGKSMRRVLAACWTPQSDTWARRRVELYCDPNVKFGGEAVGGIRISRLSDIDGPKKVPLLVSRGKSAIFTVQPLGDEPATPARTEQPPVQEPTELQVNEETDLDTLGAMWRASGPEMRAVIETRVAELKAGA